MAYVKPQSPLKDKKSGNYFYPLTTMDQIITENGNRLTSYNLLTIEDNAIEGEATPINADTLGGYPADEYVKKDELENIKPSLSIEKNYSVVGGLEQPANPTENMIWVQTETEEIGKVYFSGIEPSNCADNDIWISTSSNSSVVAFDSIRIGNDTMQTIYPISAKQYIGGAWVDKTAKSYQNGVWVDWTICLFADGNECDHITGGWVGVAARDGDFDITVPTATKTGTSLKFTGSNGSVNSHTGGTFFYTKNKIDVTSKALVVEVEGTSNGNFYIGIADHEITTSNVNSGSISAVFVSYKTNISETGTYEIPLESSGEFHIVVGWKAKIPVSAGSCNMEATNIYLK